MIAILHQSEPLDCDYLLTVQTLYWPYSWNRLERRRPDVLCNWLLVTVILIGLHVRERCLLVSLSMQNTPLYSWRQGSLQLARASALLCKDSMIKCGRFYEDRFFLLCRGRREPICTDNLNCQSKLLPSVPTKSMAVRTLAHDTPSFLQNCELQNDL